ncbi:MAG: T9SS type A sorting domain-containing protein [Flavobacteriales bacterium]|nr:T9SS type A sorting domain-containing protein [Flavobacteriales bacterium]
MKKSLLLVAAFSLGLSFAHAQEQQELKPYSSIAINNELDTYFQSLSITKPTEAAITATMNNGKDGQLEKSGILIPCNISLKNSGTWTILPGGDRLWRIRITSSEAMGLAPYFDEFFIPDGARLHVYDEAKTSVQGAFTSMNNNETGEFATWYVPGEVMVMEYYEPLAVKGQGRIRMNELSYFFRGIEMPAEVRASDPCEVDVNCSEGANWTRQRDGVVRILVKTNGATGFCSGSIINNTQQDCTPYILTAFHCGWDDAAGVMSTTTEFNQYVFRYNYQKSGCGSGTVGANVSQTGCAIRAWSNDQGGATGSDFMFVELNANIASSVYPYFNGWDANTTAPAGGVGIHHPAGDVKKISTFTATAISTKWGSGAPNGTHWRFSWAATANGNGVTEGGSSGSPLFRGSNGLIVGTLTGGASCCTANGCGTGTSLTAPDYYGKMSYHWTSNGTAANRQLKPWLDPTNSGVLTLDGAYSPCSVSVPETSLDNIFEMYPNPTNGIINITLTNLMEQSITVNVYNAFGQLVRSEKIAYGKSNHNIDLSNEAKGIYFVELISGNKKSSKKIILQ